MGSNNISSAVESLTHEVLLDLETIQFELVHDYERLARDRLGDLIARLESSSQFNPEILTEIIRQLGLAIQFLSGDKRDPKRSSRRVHRIANAINVLVRSSYSAGFEECFPLHFIRMTVTQDDQVISDDDIPPDP